MEKEFIQKIDDSYVGEDCILTTIHYKKYLTIVNKDDILYHFVHGDPFCINKYLEDERRKQFNNPSNIGRIRLLRKKHIHQLFNFNEPYIEITDGKLIENYVIKDKHSAMLIQKELPRYQRIEYKTREELEKIFEKPKEENKHVYIMRFDGSFYKDNAPLLLPSEDKIVEWTRKNLVEELEIYKKYIHAYKYNFYSDFSPYALKFFENSIDKLNIENICANITLTVDNILLIQTDGNNITIKSISIRFIKKDYYEVTIADIPITKYNLEQLKSLTPKIVTTREPEISRENLHKEKRQLKKEKHNV